MPTRAPRAASAARRRTPVVVLVALVALVVGACGDDEGGGPPVQLSTAGERGRSVVEDRGCLACHSEDGSRRTGPSWRDLAGSEVQLEGGETVVADDEYLIRAIEDPTADVVEGYEDVPMPAYDLSDEDIEDVLAYLEDLAPRS